MISATITESRESKPGTVNLDIPFYNDEKSFWRKNRLTNLSKANLTKHLSLLNCPIDNKSHAFQANFSGSGEANTQRS